MRITSIETIPVALPFRERYETATGSLRQREMILLKLVGSEGHVGYGDAVPMSLRGGPSLAAVRADLDRVCSPLLAAADLDPDLPPAEAGTSIAPLLDSALGAGAGPGALAAVEIALLDLLGRTCDAPAWALLGAADAHPVQCNGTLGAGSPDQVAEGAREMVDRGFETLKVKVGAGEDRARMEAVRDACGAGVKLRIDANGAWSPDKAVAELQALRGVDLELAEQPCATLEDLAIVRTRTDVAIVADESVSSEDEAGRAVELEACDAVTI
ncbi:MAG: enolase C-terminal domain-like protein, partial [Solirubrobacterales bacterium]